MASDFGRHGSADLHDLYVVEIPHPGTRRKCWGCQRRTTHAVMANGVALGSGCEFHAHQDRREMITQRRSRV